MTKSEADDARWLYEHRDELAGEDVEFEVAKPLSITIAFRLPYEDAQAIRDAAEADGMSVSELIRQACRARIDDAPPVDRRRLRRVVNALSSDVDDLRRATG